jgi:hypothetical protein
VSTYRATVRIDDGTLTLARPLTAPDRVVSLIDSMVYDVTQPGADVTSIDLTIETGSESDTPVGDSITATSSEPLPILSGDLDDDEDEVPTMTAGQA